jgi:hypothetical protein
MFGSYTWTPLWGAAISKFPQKSYKKPSSTLGMVALVQEVNEHKKELEFHSESFPVLSVSQTLVYQKEN